MQIFNHLGAYQITHFKGDKGVWKLIGIDNNKPGVWNSLDTFKNDKGKYVTILRSEIKKMELNGIIFGL